MVDKIIRLSFDDNRRQPVRKGTRTVARLTSMFKQENLDQIFYRLGFTTLPEPVLNTLKKYGYKYDYKTGVWKTTTSGIVKLQSDDKDEQVKADNMAMTKAKAKAYSKASRCIKEIYNVFFSTLNMLFVSSEDIEHITYNELDALKRCLKTGYCNPDIK